MLRAKIRERCGEDHGRHPTIAVRGCPRAAFLARLSLVFCPLRPSCFAVAMRRLLLSTMLLLACLAGCRRWYPGNVGQPLALNGPTPGPPLATGQFLPNPLEVPVTDSEFFWNQLVDTVDDYFEIASERRAN